MLKREVDLSEWQKLSDDWEQSGLNQKEYCKGKGISHSTFSQSRTKLMMKGLAKPYYKRSIKVWTKNSIKTSCSNKFMTRPKTLQLDFMKNPRRRIPAAQTAGPIH